MACVLHSVLFQIHRGRQEVGREGEQAGERVGGGRGGGRGRAGSGWGQGRGAGEGGAWSDGGAKRAVAGKASRRREFLKLGSGGHRAFRKPVRTFRI